MSNELSTKVYKLDFKELIDNATNKVYWTKKWEIFKYDGISITFILNSIDIVGNKLICAIELEGKETKGYWRNPLAIMSIPLKEENFNELALNKELVGRVNSLFLEQGDRDLRVSEHYTYLEGLENEFEDRLRDIAESFLKENNVYNEKIKEVYIDNYVDNNRKDYTSDYISYEKKNTYVGHRATFAIIIGFNEKAEDIIAESDEDRSNMDWIFEEAEELRLQMEEDDLGDYESELEDI